jgi:hypothetical protein
VQAGKPENLKARVSTLSASDADAVNAPPLSKSAAAIAKRAKIIAGITLSTSPQHMRPQ